MTAVLLLVTVFGGHAAAQSVAGQWNGAMNTPGGVVTFGLAFEQHGDTVAGTVIRDLGNVPLAGMIAHDTLTFSYTVDYNDHPLTLTMTSRIVGDSLKGTVDFDGEGSDAFWAARTKSPGSPAHH